MPCFLNLSYSDFSFCCLFSLEVVLAYSAQRAYPIFRDIFPCCARLYSVIRITNFRVINVTANSAYILVHNILLF